jgi:hypothetical protein
MVYAVLTLTVVFRPDQECWEAGRGTHNTPCCQTDPAIVIYATAALQMFARTDSDLTWSQFESVKQAAIALAVGSAVVLFAIAPSCAASTTLSFRRLWRRCQTSAAAAD